MNTFKAHTERMLGVALILSLGSSCTLEKNTATPPRLDDLSSRRHLGVSPPPLVDLSSRRLGGRQTLKIEDNLVLHADRIALRPDGVMQASGSVYLDGHRLSSTEPNT